MPFITFTTTKTLTLNQEKALKSSAGKLISILPNKKEENLMIHIEDNQVMYFKGKEIDCMKIECQLFHEIEYHILFLLSIPRPNFPSSSARLPPYPLPFPDK